VMVGDSPADDVQGAQAIGMRAFLIDREGRFSDREDALPTLLALPAALGLDASLATGKEKHPEP
jgi:FMN phosphatase YigB (HAD superfamily)